MSSNASSNHRIKTLTTEEINTLQCDAALRLLMEHSNLLVDINNELMVSNRSMLEAKIKVDECKNNIRIIKQNMMAFQTIARAA